MCSRGLSYIEGKIPDTTTQGTYSLPPCGAHRVTLKGNFFVFWVISKILKPTTKCDEWYHIIFNQGDP